jgi:hypothetical protein
MASQKPPYVVIVRGRTTAGAGPVSLVGGMADVNGKAGRGGRPTRNPGSARSIVASEHERPPSSAKDAANAPPAKALPARRSARSRYADMVEALLSWRKE